MQSKKQKHPTVHNELKNIGKTLKKHNFTQNEQIRYDKLYNNCGTRFYKRKQLERKFNNCCM